MRRREKKSRNFSGRCRSFVLFGLFFFFSRVKNNCAEGGGEGNNKMKCTLHEIRQDIIIVFDVTGDVTTPVTRAKFSKMRDEIK